MPFNIEIKAKTQKTDQIRQILRDLKAEEKGLDLQIDSYFNCGNGRLKLREGTIEHSLIFYQRENQAGPKSAQVHLYHPQPNTELKEVLKAAYGIWKEVTKEREIFFIDNVKFHLDEIENLGTFVEIEAIDIDGSIAKEQLLAQCQHYMKLFEIKEGDLLTSSYSDMI